MKRLKTILAVVVLIAATFTTAYAEPIISKEEIPENIHDKVREHIERLSMPEIREHVYAVRNLGAIGEEAKPAVPILIKILQDKRDIKHDLYTKDLIRETMKALGKIGDQSAFDILRSFYMADHKVRDDMKKLALTTMRKIDYSLAFNMLIEELYNKDYQIRWKIVRELRELGDLQAVEPFKEYLKKEGVPSNACEDCCTSSMHIIGGLGKFKDPRAVEPLINLLKSVRDTCVIKAIVFSLGEIGDKSAIEPLIILLKNKSVHVQEKVANTLNKLGWQPSNQSEKIAYLIAKQNWEELIKIGEPSVQPLIDGFDYWEYSGRGVSGGGHSVYALGEIGDKRAVKPLIKHYMSLNEHTKLSYYDPIEALDKIDPNWRDSEEVKNSIPIYIDKMKKGDYNAAYLLSGIGDDYVIDTLIEAMKTSSNSILRKSAIRALGKLGNPRALEPLLEAFNNNLDNRDSDLATIAYSLGGIGDKRAVEPLISILTEKRKGMNLARNVVMALGMIGDNRAVEPLMALINDKDYEVRRESIKALGKIVDPRPVKKIIFVLLNDISEDVIIASANALGKMGDPKAIEPLISKISNEKQWLNKIILENLNKLTGQDLGENPDKWLSWWEKNKGKFENISEQ